MKSYFILMIWIVGLEAKDDLYVTTVQNKPYIFADENNKLDGFLMELLENIGNKTGTPVCDDTPGCLGIHVRENQDSVYGRLQDDGSWTGMMGEVTRGEAHFALADITITAARERAVDFSIPFMQTGITILYSPPTWSMGTINSLEDLINSDNIKFGCVRGGATENFFKNSKVRFYNNVWERMNAMDSMTSSNAEGVERVLSGGYAYLMESGSAEWAMRQHCGLTTVGDLINMRSYGIAMAQGSKYRKIINIALLELMEEGVISELRKKWWNKDSRQCDKITDLLASLITF